MDAAQGMLQLLGALGACGGQAHNATELVIPGDRRPLKPLLFRA